MRSGLFLRTKAIIRIGLSTTTTTTTSTHSHKNTVMARYYATTARTRKKSVNDDPPKPDTSSPLDHRKLLNKQMEAYIESNNALKEALAARKIKKQPIRLSRHEPTNLFCVSPKLAEDIAKAISQLINKNVPIVETNPGPCFLTKALLTNCKENLYYIYDSISIQNSTMKSLQSQFPKRIKYFNTDFFSIWKLGLLDKEDNGNRVEKVIEGLINKNSSNVDPSIQVIGSTTSPNFLRQFLMAAIFQNSCLSLMKPDFFYILSPKIYYSFQPIETEDGQCNVYRCMPALFNVLFDMKLIKKVPRKDFFPWYYEKPLTQQKNISKIVSDEKDWLYLVHIKSKESPVCSERLPLLWHFFKTHLRNKTNRIIPILEQWIPGCGIWLITDQNPPGTNMNTMPGENDSELPHMTIFTRFSDLTPMQNLTVFKKFISWPEFEHSAFQDSLEHELEKFLTKHEEKYGISLQEEDENEFSNEEIKTN